MLERSQKREESSGLLSSAWVWERGMITDPYWYSICPEDPMRNKRALWLVRTNREKAGRKVGNGADIERIGRGEGGRAGGGGVEEEEGRKAARLEGKTWTRWIVRKQLRQRGKGRMEMRGIEIKESG